MRKEELISEVVYLSSMLLAGSVPSPARLRMTFPAPSFHVKKSYSNTSSAQLGSRSHEMAMTHLLCIVWYYPLPLPYISARVRLQPIWFTCSTMYCPHLSIMSRGKDVGVAVAK